MNTAKSTSSTSSTLPSVLVIAGFDPSGGAGVLADTKTIHANGGYAACVISAITVQNTQGVKTVDPIDAVTFQAQLSTLAEDMVFDAIKIGMLASLEQVQIVSEFLKTHNLKVVLDPVLISSSGQELLPANAIPAFIEQLIPKATLLTPNRPEADFLAKKINRPVTHWNQVHRAQIAATLSHLNCANLLLKGGHSETANQGVAEDWLFSWEDPNVECFRSPWLKVQHNHGTGCTLASAIATQLAFGHSVSKAVELGKRYLSQALAHADQNQPNYHPLPAGKTRHGSLHHFFN